MDEWKIYRFKDHRGRLLYIGITKRPIYERFAEHNREKPWAHKIFSSSYETLPYTELKDVLNYEKHAIRKERPKYNVVNNVAVRASSDPEWDLEGVYVHSVSFWRRFVWAEVGVVFAFSSFLVWFFFFS